MSDHSFDAWCSQHDCHPMECFWEHNKRPETRAATPEELEAFYRGKHVTGQMLAKERDAET